MLGNFKGYGSPQTRRGQASAYGPPPWHMSGRNFTIWYRPEDPGELLNYIAPPLQVPDDALCRARFWELTHDAGQGDNLVELNPAQAQFQEAVLAIDASYAALRGDYSVHIYADEPTYTAWAREVIGWPVKMGNIHLTRAWHPHALQAGITFTGILERFGSQVMKASVTLTQEISIDQRPYAASNWFTYKVIPSAEKPEPEVCQLVLIQPAVLGYGPIWKAEGTLEIAEGINDELHFLRPAEIVFAEYWSFVELSVGYGQILARL